MRKLRILLMATTIGFTWALVTPAQKITATADAETGHTLTVTEAEGDLPTLIETDGAGKSTLTPSPDKAYTAYALCVPSKSTEYTNCASRVFVRDDKTRTVYELRGEELFIETGRPIDNIKWTGDTLSYDRWSSPHVGRRYVVDMKTLKQTKGYILAG